MKTCKKCGETKPFDAFYPHPGCKDGYRPDCRACHNAAGAARREANLEQAREADRRRYAENPQRQEAQKATAKAFYQADRERQKELRRVYYREHPEAFKRYRAKRRALKKATHEAYRRLDIYDRDVGRCQICGTGVECEPNAFHVDHIIPLAQGGTDTPDNLQLTCPSCNRAKGSGYTST